MSDQEDRPSSQVGNVVSQVTVKALQEMDTGDMSKRNPKPPSRPPSQASRRSSARGSKPASPGLEIVGSRPGSATQRDEDRPASVAQGASRPESVLKGSSRPGSAVKGNSRPGSAAKGGSRPGSAGKPPSRPGSATRAGSRPASAVQDGSRPVSAVKAGSRPPSETKQIAQSGSRPTSAVGKESRPDSAAAKNSRSGSAAEETKQPSPAGSRPMSRQSPVGAAGGQTDRPQSGRVSATERVGSRPNSAAQQIEGENRPASVKGSRPASALAEDKDKPTEGLTGDPAEEPTEPVLTTDPMDRLDFLDTSPARDDPMNYSRDGGDGGDGGDDGGDGDDDHEENDDMYEIEDEEQMPAEDDDEQEMVVLDPDHPLMVRFQKALNKHLNQVNDRLSLELRELEESVKKNTVEREDLGVDLYGVQQELAKYQTLLEKYHDEQSEKRNEQLRLEHNLDEVRAVYSRKQTELNMERSRCSKLLTEVENLALKTYYMEEAKKDMRGDLAVMKRAAEKADTEVSKAEVEKQKQDLYVNRLIERSDRLREDIALFEAQVSAQNEETKAARKTLGEAQMEIETINMEKKQLFQQWNSSLIGMRRRDEAHSAMLQALKEQEQRVLTLNTEIEAYKRSISKEQEKNEKLTLILNKTETDVNGVKKSMALCAKKYNDAKHEYSTRQRLLFETEQSLNKAVTDKTLKVNEVEAIRKQIEREYSEKVKVEDEILEKIRSQMTMDKAAKYTYKMTHKLRSITRELESTKAKIENDISKSSSKVFDVQTRIDGLKRILEELDQEVKKRNETISKSEVDMNKKNALVERKQQTIDLFNKKLEQMIEAAGGVELGPLEIQINSLTKSIDSMQTELADLQQIWLRDQSQLVRLATEKDSQSSDIEKLKKQLTILSQKKIRIESDINRQLSQIADYERQIRNMQNDMIKLNTLVHREASLEDRLNADNSLSENDFISRLREAERDSIEMQEKMDNLKEEKERLLNSLIEAERQIMLWEKKTQLAKETRAAVDSEVGQGEIKAMKSEIHRMQVRYSQLMRQQEKMIQEMEKAVSRRDTIVTRGDAQTKMNKKTITKGTFHRNLAQLRQKIKQTIHEAAECDKQIAELKRDQEQLTNQLEDKQLNVHQLKQMFEQLEIDIDQLRDTKAANKFDILSKQQKTKWLNQLKEGKYNRFCRDQEAVDMELSKQLERTQALAAIVDRLNQEFPQSQISLRRVTLALRQHTS